MHFHVGQRVVCVNGRNWPAPRQFGDYTPTHPKQGEVYTVRAIVLKTLEGYDEDGLHLVEIVNPTRTKRDGSTFELAFRMSRFRPVRTTKIDVFLRTLEPEPAGNLLAERRMLEAEQEQERIATLFVYPNSFQMIQFVDWSAAPTDSPKRSRRWWWRRRSKP
jgi:hypothetical protein